MVHTLTCKCGLIAFSIWMKKVVNLMLQPLLTWKRAPSTKLREGWVVWIFQGKTPSSAHN